jgi:Mrp family chromosome partitioning ATPase
VSEPDPSILKYYLGIVWRWKWLLVVPLVVLPALVLALSLRQPPLYGTTAYVLLNHQDQVATTLAGVETPPEDAGRYAITQALVARSPELGRRVLAAAGFPNEPARTLFNESDVEPNADVLQFYVTNRSAEVANRLANAYAREYTTFRRELDTRELEATVQSLGARLSRLADASQTGSAEYGRLDAQREQVRLLEALRRSNVYVIRTSTVGDTFQLAPRPLKNAALSAGGALVLGLLLVALANAFDRRVFDPREIAAAIGAPLLARAPKGRDLSADDGLRLAALVDRAASAAGARSMLLATAGTSSRSALASALAEGLAHVQGQVVLVDADLRRRELTHAYGLLGRPGLVERVRGDGPAGEPLVPEGSDSPEGLRVLAAGADVRDPAALLVSTSATKSLRDLAGRSDLVLVAGPPFAAPESLALAAAVDAILLAIRTGVDRRALAEARRMLDVAPARMLGFVLLDRERSGSRVSRGRRVAARRPSGEPASEVGVRVSSGEAAC